MKFRSLGASALSAFLAPLAVAGSIAVVNPSFEDPALLKGESTVDVIPGWTTSNLAAAGVFHPGVAQFPTGAPDGVNTAYTNGDTIAQTLGDTLQAGVVYTLSVDAGARLDTLFFGGVIEIAAGGATLHSLSVSSVPAGGFATFTITFNVIAGHPQIGQPLEIRLVGFGGSGAQINFDNVRLDTEPFVPTARHVPAEYPTIQAAIDACFNGDQVIVAPGTYTEFINTLGKAITVRSSDGAAATSLDGMGNGPLLTMSAQEGRETVVEGFTFRNCVTSSNGGAVQLLGANPTIRNCIFSDNVAAYGGALSANGNPRIEGCAFRANHANQEGGAINLSAEFSDEPIEVLNCSFTGNTTDNSFAGAALISGPFLTVRGCSFTNNSTGVFGAGGALFLFALEGVVQDCQFTGNQSGLGGAIASGAFFLAGDRPTPGFLAARGVGPVGPPLTIRLAIDTCAFWDNSASEGGAVALIADPTISFFPIVLDGAVRNCAFAANDAIAGKPVADGPGLGGSGGAIAFIEHLTASTGGGFFIPSRLLIGESTFAQNTAAGVGGGIWHEGESPVRVVGCVLWGNSDSSGAGEFSQFFAGPADSANRSCIQGYASIPGAGNTASDPLFVDEFGPDSTPGTGDEDFRLAALSPCVDAGDAEGVASTTGTDILGSPRVADDPASPNTGVPVAGFGWIDMGAFERQTPGVAQCLGDENEDGVVDFFDLNNVLGGFGAPCFPPR